MLRFESPVYFYLFLIIPVLVLLWLYSEYRQKKKLNLLADKSLLKVLMPDFSIFFPRLRFIISIVLISLMIIVLARPQAGSKVSNEKRQGIEVMVAVDISNSMLAEDVSPSRLEKSKMLIENMISGLSEDKVGVVVFAGTSYVQLPITSDFVSAKMFLQNMSPSLIETQGTDIGGAIKNCRNSFPSSKKNCGRAIIIITDGEDHEGAAVEEAKKAHSEGINIFVLGIGLAKGSLIPDGNGGYMCDSNGKEVISILNEDMCNDIAKAGSGAYIHVDNTNKAQEQLDNELSKLQKGDLDSIVYSEYDEQFQTFALLCVILIILQVIILDFNQPLLKKLNLFNKKGKNNV